MTGSGSSQTVRVATTQHVALAIIVAIIATGCSTFTWGANTKGQLGNGTTSNDPTTTPAEIALPGAGLLWTAVDAGGFHTCQVRIDDTMWCWGQNHRGQLGDGTTTDRATPTQVIGTGWSDVSAGHDHTCGIKTDATLWCWGENDWGQLGDGTTTDRSTPTQIPGDWHSVAASTGRVPGLGVPSIAHTCALRTDGSLWCWGSNTAAQLGIGSTSSVSVPTQVGTANDWNQIRVGNTMSCATRTNGTLWCWGSVLFEQMQHRSPHQVGANTDWARISIGASYLVTLDIPGQEAIPFDHICGTKADGSLWCWGANLAGQLGLGTAPPPTDPGSFVFAPTRVGTANDWVKVEAGPQRTCGIRVAGPQNALWCWGEGDGTPAEVDLDGKSVYQVAVGGLFGAHTAALTF